MSNPIDFFFEFGSPYSYLASLELPALAARHGRPVRWRPIDITAVWAAHGPLEAFEAVRPQRRGYIVRDAARVAAHRGVTITYPKGPPDAAMARLAVHGLAAADPERATRFAQAVWRRLFGEGQPIGSASDLAAASGLSAQEIEAAAAAPSAARSLAEANDAATRTRCFGVPWIVVGDQSYFGQDRLYLVDAQLAEESP